MDTIDGKRVEVSVADRVRPATPMTARVIREGPQLILRAGDGSGPADGAPFGDTGRRSASAMYAPIRHGRQVIGVFSLQSYEPKAYHQEDLCTIQDLADHCGGALERVRIEAARRKTEARKSAILESALDGVITLDSQGRIVEFNPAAERVFGYPRPQVIGRTLAEVAIPPALLPADREELKGFLASGQGFPCQQRVELKALRADGSEFPIEMSLARIAGEEPPMFTAVIRDLTERLELEAQLRHAQKLESVGQLAAGVAHDFNNILNVILGYASLLLARPQRDPELTEPLKEIAGAAERAANLTRQLLTFSRKQIMQLRVVDLSQIVSQVLNMLRRLLGEHVGLQFRCGANLPLIHADTSMMEQLLVNLAVNARDSMPKGGQLTITLSAVNLGEEEAKRNPEARPGSFICLSVADTGCGMDAQTLSRIFEPFFTTKDVGKGTGLGLASVYGMVKQHSGWIEVKSAPGRGSTFDVYLPAAAQTPATPEPGAPTPSVRGGGETILVVEDEPALRELACQILRRYGYEVLSAATGLEALKVWTRHATRIDLLLTDMVMPGGLSGADLADQVHAQNPKLKVICTSGYSHEIANLNAVLREGWRFLPKPYSPMTLAASVRQCLDGQNPEAKQ
jgi:PAS domain S-box-containing protein